MSATTGEAKPRAQLLLPVRNRAAFLDAYFSRAYAADPTANSRGASVESGGLFVPGEIDVELGDELDVELFFTEEQVRFHIRAVVRWKRAQAGRRSLPVGVGIEFLPSEERTHGQVVKFAEGKASVTHVERGRRWAMAVGVRVVAPPGVQFAGTTDDVSDGGCFVPTDLLLSPGAPLRVSLRSPSAVLFPWLTMPAVVAWRREQAGRNGIGVEFRFGSERQKKKLRKLLAVWKERSLRDVRVKVPRTTSTPPTDA